MPARRPTFVVPDTKLYATDDFGGYGKNFHTYSFYNYFRPGLLQRYKRRRFNIALRLAGEQLFDANVIDVGCADGPLLPTLSKYCKHALAIDMNQKYLDVSVVLKDTLKLDNVEIRNNSNMSFEQLEETFQDREYDIAFVLETMEHVGTVDDMYGSRSEFLKGVFSLLKPGPEKISIPTRSITTSGPASSNGINDVASILPFALLASSFSTPMSSMSAARTARFCRHCRSTASMHWQST